MFNGINYKLGLCPSVVAINSQQNRRRMETQLVNTRNHHSTIIQLSLLVNNRSSEIPCVNRRPSDGGGNGN